MCRYQCDIGNIYFGIFVYISSFETLVAQWLYALYVGRYQCDIRNIYIAVAVDISLVEAFVLAGCGILICGLGIVGL